MALVWTVWLLLIADEVSAAAVDEIVETKRFDVEAIEEIDEFTDTQRWEKTMNNSAAGMILDGLWLPPIINALIIIRTLRYQANGAIDGEMKARRGRVGNVTE